MSVPDNPRSRRPRLRLLMTEPARRPFSVHVPLWGWGSRGRGRSQGSSAFTLVPTDQRDISSPGCRRGVLLSWFSGKQKRREGDRILGRSQKRPVRESSPSRRPPRLSCRRGSALQKGCMWFKGLVDFTTWQAFSSRQDFTRRDYCSLCPRGLASREALLLFSD